MNGKGIIGLALGAWCAGAPGTAVALDLAEAHRLAQRNDPVYEAATHARDAAAERLPQARAGLLPEVRLTGSARRTEGDVSFDGAPEVSRSLRSHDMKLELVQPLFRVQNWAAYSQARLLGVQAEAQHAQARNELILRVAQAYFDVLGAEDALAVALAQQQAMTGQLELVTRGQRAGTATLTDVHEARSRADLAGSQVIAARNEVTVRRSLLEQLLGVPPMALARLRHAVRWPDEPPAPIDRWTAAAREQSSPVVAARAALEIAGREVTRARAGHLPSLDLVASRGHDYTTGSLTSPTSVGSRSDSTTVALQLSMPLFASGAVSARVDEARALERKARAELEAAQRAATHQARQAHTGVLSGMAQITAMEQAVLSSQRSVEGNRIGFRVGTRLNVDVLNAEQQRYTAERDLARARYETIMQGLRLKAAAGQLTEEDLLAVNALLSSDTSSPSGTTP